MKSKRTYRYDPPKGKVVSRNTLRLYVRKNATKKIRALAKRVKALERAVRKLTRHPRS
jgi:hypothetical protein